MNQIITLTTREKVFIFHFDPGYNIPAEADAWDTSNTVKAKVSLLIPHSLGTHQSNYSNFLIYVAWV